MITCRTFSIHQIDETEWVEGVAILCRGTPDQLIDFCYTTYDINGDKSLAREELHHCMVSNVCTTHSQTFNQLSQILTSSRPISLYSHLNACDCVWIGLKGALYPHGGILNHDEIEEGLREIVEVRNWAVLQSRIMNYIILEFSELGYNCLIMAYRG